MDSRVQEKPGYKILAWSQEFSTDNCMETVHDLNL